MTFVIDASAVVPASLVGAWAGRLRTEERVAPSLLWSEAASAIRQLRYRQDIDEELAGAAFAWLEAADIHEHSSKSLVREAAALADRLGWAKTYDAEYVVLAQRLNVPLVTADMRLWRTVESIVSVIEPEAL